MNMSLNTKYGLLNGLSRCEFYDCGSIKECTLNSFNQIPTNYGVLSAQYDDSNPRKKFTKSMSFYESGALKTIALEEQTLIKTPTGTFTAELMSFYESGAIKRLFPLNGKITGYWSEDDEYKMASELTLNIGNKTIKTKAISVYFYESGAIKGLTLWPQDRLKVSTPIGKTIYARIGITFYSDGSIKSLEPYIPVSIDTPIGMLEAFNSSAIGINGDINSLRFDASGKVIHLMTSTDKVTVTGPDGTDISYQPKLVPNPLIPDKKEISPLIVEFKEKEVIFNNSASYEIDKYSFKVSPSCFTDYANSCGDCGTCKAHSPCGLP